MRTEPPSSPRRRLSWPLRLLLALGCCALILAGATAAVAVTRSVADDGLVRRDAVDCASPGAYVKHAPLEMEACLRRAVRADIRRRGVIPALMAVQRDANSRPILKTMCHLALHSLGREQLREGLTVSQLDHRMARDANWNSSCAGGFLHGYLQAMSELSPRGELLDLGRDWCTTLARQNLMGCAHAVGHGLSRSDRNDLVASAEGCRSLPRTLHRDCLSGAVMELNFADERLAGRMRIDDGLGRASRITCGSLAADQRTWCRALVVKGEVLITGLTTIA